MGGGGGHAGATDDDTGPEGVGALSRLETWVPMVSGAMPAAALFTWWVVLVLVLPISVEGTDVCSAPLLIGGSTLLC